MTDSPYRRVFLAAFLVTLLRLLLNLRADYPRWDGETELWNIQQALGWPNGTWTDWFLLRHLPYITLDWIGLHGVFWSRFPQSVLLIPTALAVAYAGHGLRGQEGALAAGLTMSVMPAAFVWYGRAMPDAWLTLGFALAAAGILNQEAVHGRKLWLLGLVLCVFSKPIGALALVSLIHARTRRVALWGLIPLGGALLALLVVPGAVFSVVEYVMDRPDTFRVWRGPGAYWTLTLWHAILLGAAPFWATLYYGDWRITAWAYVFLIYACIDAWSGTPYYALPAIPLLALNTAAWRPLWREKVIRFWWVGIPFALLAWYAVEIP